MASVLEPDLAQPERRPLRGPESGRESGQMLASLLHPVSARPGLQRTAGQRPEAEQKSWVIQTCEHLPSTRHPTAGSPLPHGAGWQSRQGLQALSPPSWPNHRVGCRPRARPSLPSAQDSGVCTPDGVATFTSHQKSLEPM